MLGTLKEGGGGGSGRWEGDGGTSEPPEGRGTLGSIGGSVGGVASTASGEGAGVEERRLDVSPCCNTQYNSMY